MTPIKELTDADALKVADLISGWPEISDESKIYQVKDLIATNRLYNNQTNIPGMRWYRIFRYLESAGYIIDKESQPCSDQIAGMKEALENLIKQYSETIEKYKDFSNTAFKNMNPKAADMWDHKSDGLKQAIRDINNLLASYNQSPSTGEQEEWEDVGGKRYLLVGEELFYELDNYKFKDGGFEADCVTDQIRVMISKNDEGYFVSNAMNGYGNNCKKEFESKQVVLLNPYHITRK